jgi:hypothetical protein
MNPFRRYPRPDEPTPTPGPLRTEAAVLADLTTARHRAGRMTTADPSYGPLHTHISDLVSELLEIRNGQ